MDHPRYKKLTGGRMQGIKKERWFQLCQQAAVEQDPIKLLDLITEINDLLEEKERHLEAERKASPHPTDL
jgi:hypothetical protein